MDFLIFDKTNEKEFLDYKIGEDELSKFSLSFMDNIFFETNITSLDLIFTSVTGLYTINRGLVTKHLNGPCYGITKQNNTFYVYRRLNYTGQVFSFQFINGIFTNPKNVLWGLSRGIHQIDFIGDDTLLLTDPYLNRIQLYSDASKIDNLYWRDKAHIIYPFSILDPSETPYPHGIPQGYCHFNSIYAENSTLYLVAHNCSTKTRKPSELFSLDLLNNFQLISKKSLIFSDCHNYVRYKGNEIWCGTAENKIAFSNREDLTAKNRTRGLSISDDYFIYGESKYEPVRENRMNQDGFINILDHNFNLLKSLEIKNAPISDLRRLKSIDYSFSNSKF